MGIGAGGLAGCPGHGAADHGCLCIGVLQARQAVGEQRIGAACGLGLSGGGDDTEHRRGDREAGRGEGDCVVAVGKSALVDRVEADALARRAGEAA